MAKIVIALGGNALQTGNAFTADDQKKVARRTAKQIVGLVLLGHELAITHGNGPQVGDIMLGEEASASPTNAIMPLETNVAMSQGQIGYWLQQAIDNELRAQGIKKDVATVVTQVVVLKNDPAFKKPSKPVGEFYTEAKAKKLAQTRGWTVQEDAGRGWRRVVPSPRPVKIVEDSVLTTLITQGIMPIAVGGGGVPVFEKGSDLVGIDAVIDKDFAATRLAEAVGASILMLLTDVDHAVINFKKADETPITRATIAEMETYVGQNQFAPGSMLPKVQAAIDFVKNNKQNLAIITSLDKAVESLSGKVGTVITA
ncbi:carbamate kinase [Candidatus Saccharibacteria bacterium]|nr:carbamate kinase [Candidatus Saccharibacteria bacterium]